MIENGEKRVTFRRRSTVNEDPAIAEQAARELEDLKSDRQWTSASAPIGARGDAASPEPRQAPAREQDEEPAARVQAMVPKSLRDDFLVATRRAGTTAQQAIADFVRGYVESRGDRR